MHCLFTPWRVETWNGSYSVWTQRDNSAGSRNNYVIADGIQRKDEAFLLAAAPELLNQLKALVSQIESVPGMIVPPNVKTAIIRAEGGLELNS